MAKTIRYHSLFECDVIEAANWYDNRSPGLEDAFVVNVRLVAESIIADPDRIAATCGGLRYRRVRRFPYVVLFDVDDREIYLVGVLHTALNRKMAREPRLKTMPSLESSDFARQG